MRITTLELLSKAVEMGFNREKALLDIDKSLDEEFGFDNRKPIDEEFLSNELFDTILLSFQCELDELESHEKIADNEIDKFIENLSSHDIDLINQLYEMVDFGLSFEVVNKIKNKYNLKNKIEKYIKEHVKEHMIKICEITVFLWANGFNEELELSKGLHHCSELYLEAIEHVLNEREE